MDIVRKPAPRCGNAQVLGQVILPVTQPPSACGSLGPKDSQTESRECRALHMLDSLKNGPEVIKVRKSTTNNKIFFFKEYFLVNGDAKLPISHLGKHSSRSWSKRH